MKKSSKTRIGGHMSLNQSESSFTPVSGFRNFNVFEKKNELFNLNKKLVAFTLAEVLVTLVIIGIVAALVIPNVVAKYKRKVVEVQLLKSYNTIFSAVQMSEVENGPSSTWNRGESDFLNKYLYQYIKGSKALTSDKTMKELGYEDGIKRANGVSYQFRSNDKPSPLKIDDGSMIFSIFGGVVYLDDNYNITGSENVSVGLYVDINGPKKPNVIGQDVFLYEIPM